MPRSLYTEPAYYRMLFDGRANDLDFYLLHTSGDVGEVLELGVGTGRVAVHLAREGRRVLGVDRSPEMLDALASRLAAEPPEVAARVRAVRADSRELRLPGRFSRISCPFNGLAHLHEDEDLGAFFAAVRRHLAPDGRFAFDVMVPDPTLLQGGSSYVPRFEHPRTGEPCRTEETYAYDTLRQVLTIRTEITPRLGSAPPHVLELSLRQFFPRETRLLLAHHGLELLERADLGDSLGYVCRPAR